MENRIKDVVNQVVSQYSSIVKSWSNFNVDKHDAIRFILKDPIDGFEVNYYDGKVELKAYNLNNSISVESLRNIFHFMQDVQAVLNMFYKDLY